MRYEHASSSAALPDDLIFNQRLRRLALKKEREKEKKTISTEACIILSSVYNFLRETGERSVVGTKRLLLLLILLISLLLLLLLLHLSRIKASRGNGSVEEFWIDRGEPKPSGTKPSRARSIKPKLRQNTRTAILIRLE